MNNQNIQNRYNQQVRNDRRAAALQRRLDRETTGLADVDLVNRLYQNWTIMNMLLCEDHGCAYSIDSEGTLFYTPLNQDNTIDTSDWIEVDLLSILGEEQEIQDLINEVHEKLITMMKSVGEYFQN